MVVNSTMRQHHGHLRSSSQLINADEKTTSTLSKFDFHQLPTSKLLQPQTTKNKDKKLMKNLSCLAEYPVAPKFRYSHRNINDVRNEGQRLHLSMDSHLSAHPDIIDYPRHIRFSSNFASVSQIQNKMRRQRVFHREFAPAFCSDGNQANLEGVYIPNKQILYENAVQNVHEFTRARGNM